MQVDEHTGRFLKRRGILRSVAFSILILILLSVVLDHTGTFGSSGSDVSRFDRKSVTVTRAIDGDTICVRLASDG